jgi:hypothetical protein
VLRQTGRAATILALFCAIGVHWIAIQSIAWTTMLIENSKRAPLGQAIAQTLDGAHPCSLCHAVNAGKNAEKKSDLQSPTPKIDMICSVRAILLIPSFVAFAYSPFTLWFSESGDSPPVPPPRSLG